MGFLVLSESRQGVVCLALLRTQPLRVGVPSHACKKVSRVIRASSRRIWLLTDEESQGESSSGSYLFIPWTLHGYQALVSKSFWVLPLTCPEFQLIPSSWLFPSIYLNRVLLTLFYSCSAWVPSTPRFCFVPSFHQLACCATTTLILRQTPPRIVFDFFQRIFRVFLRTVLTTVCIVITRSIVVNSIFRRSVFGIAIKSAKMSFFL